MKIIKPGRSQKGWSQKLKCTGDGNGGGGCGALLLVEWADLFKTYSHHYDGSSETYVTFKCMQCGVFTDIWNTFTLNEFIVPNIHKLPDLEDWQPNT